MSRSRKKHATIKDHPKNAKKEANRKFRSRSKQAIKSGKEPPLKSSEVMNDYDVCDYVIHAWDEKSKIKLKRK